MRKYLFVAGLLLACFSLAVVAQPPEGRGRPEGGGDREGPPRSPPLMSALDTDGDGEISAEEIKAAATTLLTLDKNKDGKLTQDETRPPRPLNDRGPRDGREDGPPPRQPGGRGGPPGDRDPPEGDRPRGDGPPGDRPEGDGPDGPPPPPSPERMLEHALSFDADKDGKLDKLELRKFVEDFISHHPGPPPGGPGGGPGGREGGPGGRPGVRERAPSREPAPRSGGERPTRPQRPEGPK